MAIAPDPEFPDKGRLIGIDYGTKRVGIAVSTGDRTISSPVEVYQRRNAALDAKYFRELRQEYRPVGLVVGLPIHVGGGEGSTARHAREYGAWLSDTMKVPVTFWDERYTSVVADEYMLAVDMSRKKRKARVDMLAAHVMLQSYLEYQIALAKKDEPQEEDEPPPEGESL
ncbi:MAG: Holliday junction resolvase RuvX [Planctomycetaceae bacterium]|nr:Holliday junction resolvase RuvX [Planctomycetaceae bacterium]MCA9030632.1 Holliday junction resolvase RuvX [Planctomycetaceae bacterium]MCA9043831.1 Holliday junction resolvase RuvX [Planctomycetaceae bacterium]MCB9953741.1 Holliday junction resolvase RuvX [Planctomycetaceae bacterium]